MLYDHAIDKEMKKNITKIIFLILWPNKTKEITVMCGINYI